MSHERHVVVIETLNRCAIECSHCAMACLDEDDVKMLKHCIKLDLDCAEVCRTAASLLSRGSEHGEHAVLSSEKPGCLQHPFLFFNFKAP